jgi:hypothetical protein
MLSGFLYGQPADTSNRYAQVITVIKAITGNVNTIFDLNYFMDFGNGEKYTPDEPPKNNQGDPIKFDGPADMMIFMAKKGYRLVTTHAQTIGIGKMTGERWVTCYNFSKK